MDGRRPGRHRVGGGVEVDEAGRRFGAGIDDVTGGVVDGHPAVDGHEGISVDRQFVGELRDGDGGTESSEGRDLGGEIPVGVDPGGRPAVVDPEAEVPVDAVLDVEGATETRDDTLEIGFPPDGRGGSVSTRVGVGLGVESTFVLRQRSGPDGHGRRGRVTRAPGGWRRCPRGGVSHGDAHDDERGQNDGQARRCGGPLPAVAARNSHLGAAQRNSLPSGHQQL